MPYNLSLVANQTGIVPIFQKINTELMFGWLGTMILISVGIILFMAFMAVTNDVKRSFAVSVFLVWVTTMLIRPLGFVTNVHTLVMTIMVAFAAMSLFLGKD